VSACNIRTVIYQGETIVDKMAKTFCTQFHATLDELIDFAHHCMQTYPVHATAIHAFPFSAESVSEQNLQTLMLDPTVHNIMFTERPADLSDKSGIQFHDLNPSALMLDIGRLVSRGLEQSCFSTMDATPLWQKIGADLTLLRNFAHHRARVVSVQ